jgi:hypothetical protein
MPTFKMDVRNDGSRILLLKANPDCWRIEIDEAKYRLTVPMLGEAKGMSFGPDKRWYNLELSWERALDLGGKKAVIQLAPGRHTVRATLVKAPSGDGVMIPIGAASEEVSFMSKRPI